jgi:hypothetical protein
MIRRMRRTWSALALASFAALLLTLGAWARSYLPERLHAEVVNGDLVLLFASDGLTKTWGQPVPVAELWRKVGSGQFIGSDRYAPRVPGTPRTRLNTPPTVRKWLGVQVATEWVGATPVAYRMIAIPLGYFALGFAMAPTVWLVRRIRVRRRNAAGLCRNCGYDLRASPGVCPECGTPAGAPHLAQQPATPALPSDSV